MKKFLFLMCALFALVCVPVFAFAQGVEIPSEIVDYFGFGTFAALVAVIPIVVEFFKRFIPKMSSLATQILSWGIGILITAIAWFFNFGFIAGQEWWAMLLYGVGASLAANGVFDTGFVSGIFNKIFGKK